MDKKKHVTWKCLAPTRRRLIQLYSALLYNAHVKGFIKGEIYTGPLKHLCVPGLNCYSCPGAISACPLGALQNALSASGTRAPWYVLGILMLFGLTLGRTICGWICPFGWIQELLHKLPTPKVQKSAVTRLMSGLKYAVLVVLAIGIPLAFVGRGLSVPGFCKYLCPAGTLEGAIGLLSHPNHRDKLSMLGLLFTNKFVILIVIIMVSIFIYRAFCRFLCPLGAIYGLFSKLALLGVKVEASRCNACGRCVSLCQMDVRRVGDRECIHCGECIGVCAEKAISWKMGNIRIASNEPNAEAKKRRGARFTAWALALLFLVGVLWYVNFTDAPAAGNETTPVSEDPTPVGFEIGMACPAFIVPLYGDGEAHFDVKSCIGKPVVINFWATWCAPCVKELPHFQQLWNACGDRVAIVAIHSDLITDDVQAFIDQSGLTLPFAQDEDGSVIASLGGARMLPMTVVLDPQGHIVYNGVKSMTYEMLLALIEPYL